MGRFLLVLLVTAGTIPVSAQNRVTIGVVTEGAVPDSSVLMEIESEVRLLSPRYAIDFKSDPGFDAGWDPAAMDAALAAALNDPEVDIVLAIGALTSQAAAGITLNKPVVTTFVQRPDVMRPHRWTDDRAEQDNLTIINNARRVSTSLSVMHDLRPFDHAAVAVDALYAEHLAGLAEEASTLAVAEGVRITIWPVGPDQTDPLAGLPADADAILLTSLPRLSEASRAQLITAANQRRLSVLSLEGERDVELGALATRTPNLRRMVSRRVALNISELIRGRPTAELPAFLSFQTELFLNGRTAAALGYSPPPNIYTIATILYPEELQLPEVPLDLVGAQRLAQESNAALSISSQEVETARRVRQLNLSPMSPQLTAGGRYRALEQGALSGLLPDQTIIGSLRLRQMIYDDRLISNYRASQRLESGSRELLEAQRLDVVEQASTAYLDLVLARIFYRIRANNLELTSENLELARHRLDVGYSGPDEVFRWESELARRQSELLESQSTIETARVTLNQILGLEQYRRWRVEEITVAEGEVPFLQGDLTGLFSNTRQIEQFRNLMVRVAMENAPELRAIDFGIQAQGIELGQRKRRWFLPSLSLNLDYNYQFYRDPDLTGVPRDFPVFSLEAQYPIFLGAERSFEIGRSSSELERLNRTQTLERQLVEQRTRTSIRRMESSYPAIELTRTQAENARRNFVVVQDKYGQGLVNVTDLLEAQVASLSADQQAAAAQYVFLADLIAFQRAIGWFETDRSPEERAELAGRIQQALTQN